jgi:hypothetical protein
MKQCAEQTGCAAPFTSHEAATLPAAEAWNRPVMALAIGAVAGVFGYYGLWSSRLFFN